MARFRPSGKSIKENWNRRRNDGDLRNNYVVLAMGGIVGHHFYLNPVSI